MAPQKIPIAKRATKGSKGTTTLAGLVGPATPAGILPVSRLLETPDPLYPSQALRSASDSEEPDGPEDPESESDIDIEPATPTPNPALYGTAKTAAVPQATLKRTRDLVSPEKSTQPTKQQATRTAVDIGLNRSVHNTTTTQEAQSKAAAPTPQKPTNSASKEPGAAGHIRVAWENLKQALPVWPEVKEVMDYLETLQQGRPAVRFNGPQTSQLNGPQASQLNGPQAGQLNGPQASQLNGLQASQLNGQPASRTATEARLGALERKLDAVLATLTEPGPPKSYAAVLATLKHPPKSYAAAAAATTALPTTPTTHQPQPRTQPQPRAQPQPRTQPNTQQPRIPVWPSKENKLVIILRKGAPTPILEPLALRNSINTFIKATKGLRNVVSTISLSLKGNITITTPGHAASDVVDQAVVEKVFEGYPIDRIQTPQTWVQLVAHGAPKRPFEGPGGMDTFKDEVHTFNSCKVINNPRWLVVPGASKQAGSVVFAVASEAEGRACIAQGIVVAGVRLRATLLRPYGPTTQCFRCQGFGHDPRECRAPPRCRFDGEAHHTTHHICRTCKAQTPCQHVMLHCANCQGPHQANSTTCEVYKGLH